MTTRRDRDGDLVEVDDRAHDERCVDGWLGADFWDRPIPCPICRPHLAKTKTRLRPYERTSR